MDQVSKASEREGEVVMAVDKSSCCDWPAVLVKSARAPLHLSGAGGAGFSLFWLGLRVRVYAASRTATARSSLSLLLRIPPLVPPHELLSLSRAVPHPAAMLG